MDGNIIVDLFMRMYAGDSIAWLAFGLFIVTVGLCSLLGILWWKMPQPAKKLFMNNIVGHRPIVADAYDNKVLVFETPRIFREGVLHDKRSGWHFVPRLTKEAHDLLNDAEREIVNKTFNIQGAPGQFYLAYSGKGTIVNPELQAMLEHSRLYQSKKGNPDGYVYADKNVLIGALQSMKEQMVKIEPVWVTTLLDPRKIKDYLSKAYSKSQLLAQEIEITDSVREQYQGNLMKLVAVLGVVSVVATLIVVIKVFGLL